MMKTDTAWCTGVASDPGLQRANNEDRVFVDEAAGIFLVVDGVGGHAAGEKAAEVAVQTIPRHFAAAEGPVEDRMREAIAAANNKIFELAQENSEWQGMACVLTLAVAHDERLTVGHVGDSRLYLAWDGKLRKLTSDHSPVGEREDQGQLTEEEAMKHPRRNEVFRDVGSRLRDARGDDFIEIRQVPFRPDAAFLLCSDGLSDAVPSSRISAIVETYDGDPEGVAQRLVDAANLAGGRDNISVVFVAGPEFDGAEGRAIREARTRHAITRMRRTASRWRSVANRCAWLLAGMGLGIVLWNVASRATTKPQTPVTLPAVVPHAATIVATSDPRGILSALSAARPGDTIEVPAGRYLGPIVLKDGVTLVSQKPREAVVHTDPSAVSNAGVAVIAHGIRSGRLVGFRVEGTDAAPLATGVLLDGSAIEVEDMEISGAGDCGVRISGASGGALRANYIHDNPGCGIWIGGGSSPRLIGNRISKNGTAPGALRPGIDIEPPASPALENNVITGNGRRDFGGAAPEAVETFKRNNGIEFRISR